MSVTKNVKRVGISAGAIGIAMGAAALLAPAASAAPVAAGQLQVCSQGDYTTYVEFLGRGGLRSTDVPASACQTVGNLGTSGNLEKIRVVGTTDGGRHFQVAEANFRPSKGGNVTTYGNLDKHWAATPQV
ncbi:hypothetical protein GCM10022222_44780 [Amycolatopsis ultiminotia]|uniref:Secreted protein n=1 Tax=Amycolatopsis ultiminotia TaxID=543629 RepID=A0ABP6WXD0_9PSEU